MKRFPSPVAFLTQLFATIVLLPNHAWSQSGYAIEQVTTGSANHRAPSINNLGEIVWMEQTPSHGWQVVSSTRGQLTSPSGNYTEAQHPSLADNGSFVCFRPGSLPCTGSGYLLRYPGESTVEFCSRNTMSGAHRDPIPQTGISGDGRVIWGREFYTSPFTLSTRRFFVDGTEVSLPSTLVNWQNPGINKFGEYVYEEAVQIVSSRRGGLVAGSDPAINDKGEIAYVTGGQVQVLCRSGDIATIVGAGGAPSINSNGVVAFERLVGGTYQIFRATPPACFTCVKWLRQCDAPRNGDHYDNLFRNGQPVTVCKKGCALTCLTMGLNYAGYRIDPAGLNGFMKSTGNFAPGGSVDWLATTHEFTLGAARWRDRRLNSQTSATAANQYLDDVLCNRGFPVTVGVWKTAGSTSAVPEHYVLVVAKTETGYEIADPGDRTKTSLSQYPRFETRGYVEPPVGLPPGFAASPAASVASAVSQVSVAFSGNGILWMVAPGGRVTGIDPLGGNIVEQIPFSTSFGDSLSDDETGEPADTSTQFVYVNTPKPGKYRLLVTASQAGAYELTAKSTYDDGSRRVIFGIQENIQAGATNSIWLPVGTSLSISRLPPAAVGIELVSDRTNRFRLEASATLSNWLAVVTATLTNGIYAFIDTNAPSFNQRFYRAVSEP